MHNFAGTSMDYFAPYNIVAGINCLIPEQEMAIPWNICPIQLLPIAMDRSSIQYRQAFQAYLRKGTPIVLSLRLLETKNQDRPTTHYIWRTVGDNKVRSRHAANNGKIFAWDDPPETGHPGEDYNCRCTAEPYYGNTQESLNHIMAIGTSSGSRWEWYDFVSHFYTGNKRNVTLSQVGHLQEVANHWAYDLGKLSNWNVDIIRAARKTGNGTLRERFYRDYDFGAVGYIHGSSRVEGVFIGSVRREGTILYISGETNYSFSDRFTDPGNIRAFYKRLRETPDMMARFIQSLGASISRFIGSDLIGDPVGEPLIVDQDNVPDWFLAVTDAFGEAYNITGGWSSEMRATVFADSKRSEYK